MPQQIEPPVSALEATYKTREVEGVLDLYFYRPIGFRLASGLSLDTFSIIVTCARMLSAWHCLFSPMRWTMPMANLRA